MNDALTSVRVGDVVAGKYRVERIIGAGAMGVVAAALHVDLEELRALKLMQPAMAADAESVERFLREARAVARLKTPHVAKVHDTGRLESGLPYIVMEYLEGRDLKAVLDERGKLPAYEATSYVLQACQALGEAHGLGIIHRDLKPANLFLTRGIGGTTIVKVLDFGIAKLVRENDVELTHATAMLGSPLYMSPEQMRSAINVDQRTDIWALGAILYRMLSGRVPFPGDSVPEICTAVIAEDPAPLRTLAPEIHPTLEAIVMKCLDKNPAGRFASARDLAGAIARLDPFSTAWPQQQSQQPISQPQHPMSQPQHPISQPQQPQHPISQPQQPQASQHPQSQPQQGASPAEASASVPRPAALATWSAPGQTAGSSSWATGKSLPGSAPRRRAPLALLLVAAVVLGIGVAIFAIRWRASTRRAPRAADESALPRDKVKAAARRRALAEQADKRASARAPSPPSPSPAGAPPQASGGSGTMAPPTAPPPAPGPPAATPGVTTFKPAPPPNAPAPASSDAFGKERE